MISIGFWPPPRHNIKEENEKIIIDETCEENITSMFPPQTKLEFMMSYDNGITFTSVHTHSHSFFFCLMDAGAFPVCALATPTNALSIVACSHRRQRALV